MGNLDSAFSYYNFSKLKTYIHITTLFTPWRTLRNCIGPTLILLLLSNLIIWYSIITYEAFKDTVKKMGRYFLKGYQLLLELH